MIILESCIFFSHYNILYSSPYSVLYFSLSFYCLMCSFSAFYYKCTEKEDTVSSLSVPRLIRTTNLNSVRMHPNPMYILVMLTLVYREICICVREPCFHISYLSLKMKVRVKFSAAAQKSSAFVNPIFKTILRAFNLNAT